MVDSGSPGPGQSRPDQATITQQAQDRVHQVQDRKDAIDEAFGTGPSDSVRSATRRAVTGTAAVLVAVAVATAWRRRHHRAPTRKERLLGALDRARTQLGALGGNVGRRAEQARRRAAGKTLNAAKKTRSRAKALR
jgi:hypothetical protein